MTDQPRMHWYGRLLHRLGFGHYERLGLRRRISYLVRRR